VPRSRAQLGSVVAGRTPTVLVAWLVRGGEDPIVLQRLAMPADLGSKAAWDAVIDLGDEIVAPGDVLIVGSKCRIRGATQTTRRARSALRRP